MKTTRKQVKPVVVVPTGTSRETVRELRAGGYVVLTSKAPERVRILTPEMQGVHHDMLLAAMEALQGSTAPDKARFFDALHRAMRGRLQQVATASTT